MVFNFCSSLNNMLSFCLLFLLCECTVKSWSATLPMVFTLRVTTKPAVTTEEKLSALQLLATPDYPVAEGQRVHLHCSAFTMPNSVVWFWERMENQTWQEVNRGRNLTLTEPRQSGLYRCCAKSLLPQTNVSHEHMVYIVSTHATVGDNLGVAAFFLSLLALIINIAILSCLARKSLGDTLTTSSPAAEGFPGFEKSPKGGLPKTVSDGDVYMNYTSTNHAYTDLDPTSVTEDNVYSSLS